MAKSYRKSGIRHRVVARANRIAAAAHRKEVQRRKAEQQWQADELDGLHARQKEIDRDLAQRKRVYDYYLSKGWKIDKVRLPGSNLNKRYDLSGDWYSPACLQIHQEETSKVYELATGAKVQRRLNFPMLPPAVCQYKGNDERELLIAAMTHLSEWGQNNGYKPVALTVVTEAGRVDLNSLNAAVFERVKLRIQRICNEKLRLKVKHYGAGVVEVSYNKDDTLSLSRLFQVHCHVFLIVKAKSQEIAEKAVRAAFRLQQAAKRSAENAGIFKPVHVVEMKTDGWLHYVAKSMLLHGHCQRSIFLDDEGARVAGRAQPMPRAQHVIVMRCLQFMQPSDRVILIGMRRIGPHLRRARTR